MKSPAFAPATVMLEMVSAMLPLLVSVMLWAAVAIVTGSLPKLSAVADRLAMAAVPVPFRLTVCGLPAALSLMATAALRVLMVEGVKDTVTLQVAAGAREAPQLLLWLKSPAFVPVTAMLEMVSAMLPLFVRVTL